MGAIVAWGRQALERIPVLAPDDRRVRITAMGIVTAFSTVAAVKLAIWHQVQAPVDWALYRNAALRWEAGGGYFHPYQLAGPHALTGPDILYPPIALWLLVPFAHLPDLLWWAVPAALLGGVVWHLRPNLPALAVIAFLMTTPWVQGIYLTGRPTMWIAAFVGLGLLGGGWGVLVMLKPSLFPFALIGVGRRWWWIGAAMMVLAAAPFGSLWLDWIVAVRNSGAGLLYSLPDLTLIAIPLVAWLGRRPRERPLGLTLAPRSLVTS